MSHSVGESNKGPATTTVVVGVYEYLAPQQTSAAYQKQKNGT